MRAAAGSHRPAGGLPETRSERRGKRLGLRVLLLTDGLSNGGAERQFTLFARQLSATVPVRVLALRGGAYEQTLANNGVPYQVVWRDSHSKMRAAGVLWREILWSRPTLVHSWGTRSAILAGPLCRLLGIPLVNSTIRSARAPGLPGSPQTPLQFWAASLFASAVLANSQAGLRAYKPPKRTIGRVVYNAFEASRLAGLSGRPKNSANGQLRVIMAARMAPGKDFATLLRTAAFLSAQDGDEAWHFVLAGEGPLRATHQAAAADLIRRRVVEFAPPTTEPIGLISSCDIGVLLTDPAFMEEGCSNSLLEYMACGLPAVCNDVGGNREVVRDGVTGIVLDTRGSQDLLLALRSLRARRRDLADMARAARHDVEDRFSERALLDAMLAIYREIL